MDPQRWQRVSAIFDETADADVAGRSALLDRLCAGDSELRREVEALLAADAGATSFDRGVDSARSSAAADWIGNEYEDSNAGERIGPWRVQRELGRGGMGVVLLAERADGQFEQRAALKLIKRGMDSDAVLARFLRERQILARLEHPHIAHLLDGGMAVDGRPYFAMEFVDGEPLLRYCADRNAKLEERITLFLDICAAVQFAHGQLVVHRDIKPSNILVTANGSAKLLDFGIAKLLDDSAVGPTATIDAAHRPLTPAYAAPEQLRGEPVTTATDVYALGCVLYELLTGRRPLGHSDAPTPDEMLRAQATTDPDAPSRAAAANAPVPARRLRGDLDTILLKTLRREPQRRYATVAALADDLQRYLSGQPIAARRESRRYRIGKFVARHRVGVVAGAAAVLALLLVTAASIYEARVARTQTQQARAQARRADATREFLVGVFGQVSPDGNNGKPITAHQLLETGERELDKEFDRQPATKVEISALLGELFRDIGDRQHGQKLIERALAQVDDPNVPDEVRARALLTIATDESEDKETFQAALDHARRSVALLEGRPGADPETLAAGHVAVAYALRRQGKNEEAVQLLDASIAGDTAALGNQDKAIAEEWVQLGIALQGLRRFGPSQVAFGKALGIYRLVYGDNSQHVAHALDAFAGMLHDKGDYAAAESTYRQALGIDAAKLGPDHHDTLVDRGNLLRILELRGKFDEALAERLALVERGKASGQLTPTDLAYNYLALGIDYVEVSRFRDGEQTLRDGLALIRTAQGERSAMYAYALEFLGYALPWQGKYAEAERAFRDALALTLEKDKSVSPSACRLWDSLSWVLDLEHRYAEALTLANQVNTECTRNVPATSLQRPTFLADLSTIELDNGAAPQALAAAEGAVEAARKTYPPASYRLGVPLFALARADLALERNRDAESALREALAVRRPPYAADDPRVLEVKVELVRALRANNKRGDADALKDQIEPLLEANTSPYLSDLIERLRAP
ncbi:MAG TPA: serine/threonine-protein kinase [Rudaea sp.]|jgi:serine/threonine-protein kinase